MAFLLLFLEFVLDFRDLVVQRHFRDVFAVERHPSADMLHGFQIEPLAFVASMVDTNIQSRFLEVAIDDSGPGSAPRFDEAEVIP